MPLDVTIFPIEFRGQGKDINRRIVYVSYEMGVGKEGIAKLCEVLNMPYTMSKLTWYSHEDVLLQAHEDVVHKMLASNREDEIIISIFKVTEKKQEGLLLGKMEWNILTLLEEKF